MLQAIGGAVAGAWPYINQWWVWAIVLFVLWQLGRPWREVWHDMNEFLFPWIKKKLGRK